MFGVRRVADGDLDFYASPPGVAAAVARLGGPLDHAVGPAVAAALRAARATGGSAEPRR